MRTTPRWINARRRDPATMAPEEIERFRDEMQQEREKLADIKTRYARYRRELDASTTG